MEAYSEIIAGNRLAEVIDLPEDLKTSEVEVFIFPVKKQSIRVEDLPRHKMGRELSPVDRDHIYSNER